MPGQPIVYVDDLTFGAKDESNIHDLSIKLRDLQVDIEKAYYTNRFMRVDL